jgi:hypothetical protein
MRTFTWVTMTLALGATQAWADKGDDERAQIELKSLSDVLKHPAPGAGLDKAAPKAAPWCKAAKHVDNVNYGWIRRDLEEYQTHHYWSGLIKLSENVCSVDQRQPVIQQLVAEIEQSWINMTGMSEKNAIASIAARVDEDGFKAAKQKLCGELVVSDEVRGEDADLMAARRMLFGCKTDEAMWAENSTTDRDLIEYLDQSASDPDELVRLAYIVEHARVGTSERNNYFEHWLAAYAIRNIDFKLLSDDKTLKALTAAPYAGNAYAITVVNESLGRAHMGIAALDAEVKKRASDADWKELLIDAPTRGADAYTAEAAKYKAEIARSNEAERKLFGPSKKASAGCEVVLRKDLINVWKSLKHGTANEAKESLSDPVLGLLFSRYVGCLAVDGPDGMYPRRMYPVAADLRHGRGIRMAAYYAVLEAVAKIHADRDRFPIKAEDFKGMMPTGDWLTHFASDASSKQPQHDSMAFVGDTAKGVVKSATKSGDGVVVTFVTKKHQEMQYNCVDTNRLMSIDDNGRLHYYQNCKEAGMATINDTPAPLTVPALYADKIAAGTVVEIETTRGHDAKERWGFPVAVYADGGKKKLVNWFGFGL